MPEAISVNSDLFNLFHLKIIAKALTEEDNNSLNSTNFISFIHWLGTVIDECKNEDKYGTELNFKFIINII